MRKQVFYSNLLSLAALLMLSMMTGCVKESNGPINLPVPPPSHAIMPCAGRPVVNAQLVPFGVLSESRLWPVGGAAGSKILFAGGWNSTGHSSRVDMYDTITGKWSRAELTESNRDGMVVATVGNKILFAGGGDDDWVDLTSRVDIYDAATNKWSTAELSQPRKYLSAATIGNKIFFAGGGYWNTYLTGSDVVDIYDNVSGTWTTSKLSEGRYELSATTAGNKIFFAGGIYNMFDGSKKIDIYDLSTDTWSTSHLQEVKTSHAGIMIDNKIFWASGAKSSYQNGYHLSDQVEIRDLTTGLSTFECITPKAKFSAVVKNDNIIFFNGRVPGQVERFDIYNKTTQSWSTGILSMTIYGSAIVSLNNTIYVAGGTETNSNQVWKLEF